MELDNQSELLKWTGKTLKRIKKMAEKYFGRAAFLEMLQTTIIFQRFLCIRKLILQENSRSHIQKYDVV